MLNMELANIVPFKPTNITPQNHANQAFNQNLLPEQPVKYPQPDSKPVDIEDYKMKGTCLVPALISEKHYYKHLVGSFI